MRAMNFTFGRRLDDPIAFSFSGVVENGSLRSRLRDLPMVTLSSALPASNSTSNPTTIPLEVNRGPGPGSVDVVW